MTPILSPALTGWLSQPGESLRLAEIVIRRRPPGFLLCHHEDVRATEELLLVLEPEALREWSQTDARGMFRPNRTAPGLRRGWKCLPLTGAALEVALDGLYPGAIADWYSVQSKTATVTSFREFVGRQTGIYRRVSELDDAHALRIVQAGCESGVCLRRRLWTVADLPTDGIGEKSEVPCLEPCALLLEFARRVQALGKDPEVDLPLRTGEIDTLRACVDHALTQPDAAVREGDMAAPLNPRRLRLVRNRLAEIARAEENPRKES
ncbi:MAG: hypothetical protein JNL10_11295 [Verrucomicrobiales bacterium]|nr:hypothetical protein [Verrucomicrobiales bacterium]